MNYVSKKIIKTRAGNRLAKVVKLLNGAKTVAEVKEIVKEDWQRAEYFGVGKKDFVSYCICD